MPQFIVDIVEHLIDHSSWPIAACVIALILRRQIGAAVDRLRKVSAGPISAELEAQQVGGPAPLAQLQASIPGASDPKNPQMTEEQKKYVTDMIFAIAKGAPPPAAPAGVNVDQKTLDDARLRWEISVYQLWSIIFPQQLRALKLMKLGEVSYDHLRPLFLDTAKSTGVKNMTFDQWLGFLKTNYLVIERVASDGKTFASLSVLGSAFVDTCILKGLDRLKGV